MQDFPTSACPSCAAPIDQAGHLEKAEFKPEPGDFGVCTVCGELNKLDASMQLVKITGEDLQRYTPKSRRKILDAQRRVREFIRKNVARRPS